MQNTKSRTGLPKQNTNNCQYVKRVDEHITIKRSGLAMCTLYIHTLHKHFKDIRKFIVIVQQIHNEIQFGTRIAAKHMIKKIQIDLRQKQNETMTIMDKMINKNT